MVLKDTRIEELTAEVDGHTAKVREDEKQLYDLKKKVADADYEVNKASIELKEARDIIIQLKAEVAEGEIKLFKRVDALTTAQNLLEKENQYRIATNVENKRLVVELKIANEKVDYQDATITALDASLANADDANYCVYKFWLTNPNLDFASMDNPEVLLEKFEEWWEYEGKPES